MPGENEDRRDRARDEDRAAGLGESLRRAHPVAGDGTFGSFLRLLEVIEPVQTTRGSSQSLNQA